MSYTKHSASWEVYLRKRHHEARTSSRKLIERQTTRIKFTQSSSCILKLAHDMLKPSRSRKNQSHCSRPRRTQYHLPDWRPNRIHTTTPQQENHRKSRKANLTNKPTSAFSHDATRLTPAAPGTQLLADAWSLATSIWWWGAVNVPVPRFELSLYAQPYGWVDEPWEVYIV